MNPLDVVICSMAVWQIVEIVNHSELFATRRDRWMQHTDFWSRVFRCPWCLSVWVAGIIAFHMITVRQLALFFHPSYCLLLVPVQAFTLSRIANVGNDLFHAFCRTPRAVEIQAEGLNEVILITVVKNDVVLESVSVPKKAIEVVFIVKCRQHIPHWSDSNETPEAISAYLDDGYVCSATAPRQSDVYLPSPLDTRVSVCIHHVPLGLI